VSVAFIDAHRDRFPVAVICRAIEFPQRTFYAFTAGPACARAVSDVDRKAIILREWTANYQCYGARRLHKHLGCQGHPIARCTITGSVPCRVQRGRPTRSQGPATNGLPLETPIPAPSHSPTGERPACRTTVAECVRGPGSALTSVDSWG